MPLGGGLTIGAEALSAVEGSINFFSDKAKEKKAKQELDALKTPYYKIQDEYFQNKNLAAGLASGGLPTDTKNFLTKETDRGLGTGIGAITAGGGNPNDITKLFDTYTNSLDKTGAQDAEQHIKNIQYFMDINKDLAGQKTEQWAVNEYAPNQNKLKELTERQGASQINQRNDVSQVIGSIDAVGTSLSNTSLLNKLFAKKDTPNINVPDPFIVGSNSGSVPKISLRDLMPDGGGLTNNNSPTILPFADKATILNDFTGLPQ